MSIKGDLKSIFAEFSPILAGFKLAVIIIGYFGFGSVAKWIISYWYPFTRWMWDELALLFSFPEFPLIVKDSLTALLFFLPLGVVALFQRIKGIKNNSAAHRFWGALFGFLFLFFICKDVISSVANSIAISMESVNNDKNNEESKLVIAAIIFFYFSLGTAFYKLLKVMKESPLDGASFFSKIHRTHKKVMAFAMQHSRKIFVGQILFFLLYFLLISFELVNRSRASDTVDILGAMLILVFIVISLLLAIYYVPRKLFITTGAAVAFVLAAVLFDGFILAKGFMESVASG